MVVLGVILYVLIFGLAAFGAAIFWFRFCGWDPLFNCRNYKPLLILIPVTVFLPYLFLGPPTITKAPAPMPEKSVSVVEKSTTKTKKSKKGTATEKAESLPKKEEPKSEGINFEYLRLALFLGILFGAPGFFWFLVDSNKVEDIQTAREKFYGELDKELAKQTTKSDGEIKKLKATLAKQEGELKAAHEKLRYITDPPKTDPPAFVVSEPETFEDDPL